MQQIISFELSKAVVQAKTLTLKGNFRIPKNISKSLIVATGFMDEMRKGRLAGVHITMNKILLI